jgi:hypothetical protein
MKVTASPIVIAAFGVWMLLCAWWSRWSVLRAVDRGKVPYWSERWIWINTHIAPAIFIVFGVALLVLAIVVAV